MLKEVGIPTYQLHPNKLSTGFNLEHTREASEINQQGLTQGKDKEQTPHQPDRRIPPVIEVGHMGWEELQKTATNCKACSLHKTKKKTVFGVGDVKADIFILGEAPGANEDIQGEPFVGRAGKLLDQALKAMRLDNISPSRQHRVYITNTLKCRPPGNRNPDPQELSLCQTYWKRQLALVKPKLILAVGRFAAQAFLAGNAPLGKLRGKVYVYEETPLIITYHPAYLLRNPKDKSKFWADLCLVMETLGEHNRATSVSLDKQK
jgi:DNA polymerase